MRTPTCDDGRSLSPLSYRLVIVYSTDKFRKDEMRRVRDFLQRVSDDRVFPD
ncbi:hypothetical protein NJ7G_1227 [Natrinema sp. J7-2]|nr:hypothetical protein NJ7G_1227 [Natrinema sp. J7-2]